jgi:pyrroloquinoline quinone (PQQ) biosynthesis protein C
MFIDDLRRQTATEREFLLSAPVIGRCLAGAIDRDLYVAFLTQAYHHVRHTVPLLALVRERLPARLGWLAVDLDHYLEEEAGHEQWVLADIAASGGDRVAAERSSPAPATEAMVAYAYDTVTRGNPVGFFGMVFVLEGTSTALALQAADSIERAIRLPGRALTYLRSHGELDQQHVGHLSGILERLTEADDRASITRCAKVIYWLYAQMFRGLETALVEAAPITAQARRA